MGKHWMAKLGGSPSMISQKPRCEVVAEYVLSKSKLILTAGETAMSPQIKIVVPCLYYPRYKVWLFKCAVRSLPSTAIACQRNLQREEDFACRMLQKAFRGFTARALWRRLQFPLLEKSRQSKLLLIHRNELHQIRDSRHTSARKIQKLMRVIRTAGGRL